MPSDVPHLICPTLLCHLHRVLWSLPSSMFLSFSTEDCVCWNYVVWVFMAFAVSQALSVSFSPRVVYCVCVCVCAALKDWSCWQHFLPHIHTMHTYVRAHSGLRIFCFTHSQCWPSFWNASRHWNFYFHCK